MAGRRREPSALARALVCGLPRGETLRCLLRCRVAKTLRGFTRGNEKLQLSPGCCCDGQWTKRMVDEF
jgi:hypothetical protein